MLKVPRMLDEIDPLPVLVEDRFISKEPWQQRWTSRHIQERIYDVGKAADWHPVQGKPHFYTRNGKLKYEPLLPAGGHLAIKNIDLSSMASLEDAVVSALRAGVAPGFAGLLLDAAGRLLTRADIARPQAQYQECMD